MRLSCIFIPSYLLKVEFASWLSWFWFVTVLFPDVHLVSGLLIVERRLQIVRCHFLMEHGQYGRWHGRHDPYPIGRAAISIFSIRAHKSDVVDCEISMPPTTGSHHFCFHLQATGAIYFTSVSFRSPNASWNCRWPCDGRRSLRCDFGTSAARQCWLQQVFYPSTATWTSECLGPFSVRFSVSYCRHYCCCCVIGNDTKGRRQCQPLNTLDEKKNGWNSTKQSRKMNNWLLRHAPSPDWRRAHVALHSIWIVLWWHISEQQKCHVLPWIFIIFISAISARLMAFLRKANRKMFTWQADTEGPVNALSWLPLANHTAAIFGKCCCWCQRERLLYDKALLLDSIWPGTPIECTFRRPPFWFVLDLSKHV